MTHLEHLYSLFVEHGHSEYGGEPVTQLEHALQCAHMAEQESAPATLIAAALLHDVGHLLHSLPDDAPDRGIDDHHESSAANYLRKVFPADVWEPIRMHVLAKRYLCSTVPQYLSQLSPPSVISLELQGGPMQANEIALFESSPYFDDALRLRHWDDMGKVVGLATPTLDHFWSYVTTASIEQAT